MIFRDADPGWVKHLYEVRFEGLAGVWALTHGEFEMDATEPSRMRLEFLNISSKADSKATLVGRNRDYAKAAMPKDVADTLQALYDLDDHLPEGKEAVIEVPTVEEGKPRFTVRIIDKEPPKE